MAYPANLRGWGRGWPTDRSADMQWVRATRSGARWQVHRDIAPIVQFLVDEIERRGYLFDHGPADTDDDWGYNNRPIRGTRTPSNHSWGLAIDIDAQKYPQGTRRRPPQWIIDLFGAYGFEWGGNWSYRDPMHFEFMGSRTEARHMVAMLAASHLAAKPAPVPLSAPTPPQPEPELAMAANIVRNVIPGHKDLEMAFVITDNWERIGIASASDYKRWDRWIRWYGGRVDKITDAGDWDFLKRATSPR